MYLVVAQLISALALQGLGLSQHIPYPWSFAVLCSYGFYKPVLAYGCEDTSDAEFITKMLGTRTKKVVTRSVFTQGHGGIHGSKNSGYQALPLLRPDEMMRLKPHIALIIRSGLSPIKARQFIWYKEKSMKHCPQSPSIVPKQLIVRHPFMRPDKAIVKNKIAGKFQTKEQEDMAQLQWIDGYDGARLVSGAI
ncbi:MAG: type IV secretory system conjugative DNA transfer family protein [Tatlockia sp.]|nr:type IV secretory system conjugative DNA transfer family protein [Tatlockia sp.]